MLRVHKLSIVMFLWWRMMLIFSFKSKQSFNESYFIRSEERIKFIESRILVKKRKVKLCKIQSNGKWLHKSKYGPTILSGRLSDFHILKIFRFLGCYIPYRLSDFQILKVLDFLDIIIPLNDFPTLQLSNFWDF